MPTAKPPYTAANPAISSFIKRLSNPVLQRLYMLAKLPSIWFMGARVQELTPERSSIRLPYAWRSQNPFRSTYFAAQAAAAEISTGFLVATLMQGQGKFSMLVTHMEADFHKKATDTLIFTCNEREIIIEALEQSKATGEGQAFTLHTKGVQTLKDGSKQVASSFAFEWSIKYKG